ncbi:ImmA/IrrE family metallo-endopeptidase [Acidithiobacillus ferrooxidans]|uniref:ImmA/IrrE family metallo-endopeptidase n=1 Tax=Acidithiobacillus ferrooxidans TaxID=920 RepID=UPI000AA4594E|nr:ImmA/IrrE family metallo-endopeptidase [Acidithiobacillus ferrooxidans]
MNDTAVKIDKIFRPFTVIREHQRFYPVDVENLAADFDISVVRKDWPDNVSGAIGKDDRGYFIIVNGNHPKVRQRFTLAHEIAHYVLHRDQIGKDGIKDTWMYRSKISDPDERAANKLAAEILMPADLLGRAAVDNGLQLNERNLDALAQTMDVSTTALAIRFGVPT